MLDISEQDLIDTILAFDYGDVRIGVAIKRSSESIVEPLLTLQNDDTLWQMIDELLDLHQPDLVVVGRPRNIDGESTKQTEKAEQFAAKLADRYNNKVELQDEALSTEVAKNRIPKKLASKSRELIDQYAACVILESYLQEK
jgi:putative Holliday junction resolvase